MTIAALSKKIFVADFEFGSVISIMDADKKLKTDNNNLRLFRYAHSHMPHSTQDRMPTDKTCSMLMSTVRTATQEPWFSNANSFHFSVSTDAVFRSVFLRKRLQHFITEKKWFLLLRKWLWYSYSYSHSYTVSNEIIAIIGFFRVLFCFNRLTEVKRSAAYPTQETVSSSRTYVYIGVR